MWWPHKFPVQLQLCLLKTPVEDYHLHEKMLSLLYLFASDFTVSLGSILSVYHACLRLILYMVVLQLHLEYS
jgi:hypothetical protein